MTGKETIRILFESYYDRMYLLARILLHDDEESRDAVSDVFSGIADGSIEVREDTAESFLLTCVRNRCLKIIRSKRVRERAKNLLRLSDTTTDMMPFETQCDQLTALLVFAEQELTPQTHRVFLLRYQQHKTYAEIASELSISEAAVYKHIAQALRKIKSHFNP